MSLPTSLWKQIDKSRNLAATASTSVLQERHFLAFYRASSFFSVVAGERRVLCVFDEKTTVSVACEQNKHAVFISLQSEQPHLRQICRLRIHVNCKTF